MTQTRTDPNAGDLHLRSPAKVNLALSVGAPRPDGFHPIASWMVAVDFGDDVTLRIARDPRQSRFDIAFALDAPQPQAVDWPLEKDLGWRALRLLEQATGRTLAVDVTVRKRIPAGAGLGGGSGNAAAVLVGVNRLLRLGLDEPRLMDLGRQLGCDVAFAVAALGGRPSMIATGLGEQLDAAPLARPVHLVLLLPPLACPTGAVYRQFDAQASGDPADVSRIRQLVADGPGDAALFNDLAEPAMAVTPALRDLRSKLAGHLGQPVHVTGSGAAMFLLADGPDGASRIASKAAAVPGIVAVATKTRP